MLKCLLEVADNNTAKLQGFYEDSPLSTNPLPDW